MYFLALFSSHSLFGIIGFWSDIFALYVFYLSFRSILSFSVRTDFVRLCTTLYDLVPISQFRDLLPCQSTPSILLCQVVTSVLGTINLFMLLPSLPSSSFYVVHRVK